MKKFVIMVLMIFLVFDLNAKSFTLKVDKFNNQKNYIEKKFADVGTAAGARSLSENSDRSEGKTV